MASITRTRAGRFLDKIAVAEVEPGLTGGQLMLANHDLKPVEPGWFTPHTSEDSDSTK